MCIDNASDRVLPKNRFVIDSPENLNLLSLIAGDIKQESFSANFLFSIEELILPPNHKRKVVDIPTTTPRLLTLTNKRAHLHIVITKDPSIIEAIRSLLTNILDVVVFDVYSFYFCTRSLGIKLIKNYFDLKLSMRLLSLGSQHWKYKTTRDGRLATEHIAKAKSREDKEANESLVNICRQFGDGTYPLDYYDYIIKLLRQNYSDLDSKNKNVVLGFSESLTDSSLSCYPNIKNALLRADLLDHINEIEFPCAVWNAEHSWNGVRIDEAKLDSAIFNCHQYANKIKTKLFTSYGINNPDDGHEILLFLKSIGKLEHFAEYITIEGISLSKDHLEKNIHIHPAINLLFEYHKSSCRHKELSLYKFYISPRTGLIHAISHHLGGDTGRFQYSDPALSSIGKINRPIIIPTISNNLIGEADFSQFDFVVAAGISNDAHMIQDYHSGDAYSANAKYIFNEQLDDAQKKLSNQKFQHDHNTKKFRNQAKPIFLSVMYNRSAHSLAQELGITELNAKKLISKIFTNYKNLHNFLNDCERSGAKNGFAKTITGLKRFRGKKGALNQWEKNWMRNTPIQGSASDIFKVAYVKVSQAIEPYQGRVTIHLHDAIVFEAPKEHFNNVANIVHEKMISSFKLFLPSINVRVDMNIANPSCWNKDGDKDSIERFKNELVS